MADALRAGTRVDADTVLFDPKLAYQAIGIGTSGLGTIFSWQFLSRATQRALGLLANFVFHPVYEPRETQERLQESLSYVQSYSGTAYHLANIARDSLPGVDLSEPYESTNVTLDRLPGYVADGVRDGVAADDLEDARSIVQSLAEQMSAPTTGEE